MTRELGPLAMGLALLLGASHGHAAPAERVTRDAQGRVVERVASRPDGGSRRSTLHYAGVSTSPLRVVDEDLDARGRPTARVERRFDDDGRLSEKIETRVDTSGRSTGARTLYSYDANGRRSERVAPLR